MSNFMCIDCRYLPMKRKDWIPQRGRTSYCKYITGNVGHYRGEQRKRSTMWYLNKFADCPYFAEPFKWWQFWKKV